MSLFFYVGVALVGACAAAPASLSIMKGSTSSFLDVSCTFKGCDILINGKVWSSSNITQTRANGELCSNKDGTLKPVTMSHSSGSDSIGKMFNSTTLLWGCHTSAGTVPFETAVRVYSDPTAIVFSQRWPEGAANTATQKDVSLASQDISSAFPALTVTGASKTQTYLVYYNQMVGGMAHGTTYGWWDDNTHFIPGGTESGPIVINTPAFNSAVVVSPITNPLAMNMNFDNMSRSVRAGIMGSVASVPANYTIETMLFLGPRTTTACAPYPCGVNSAVRDFGVTLRRYKGKDTGFPAGGYEADQTLSHLGYYSDNGAYYYYYTSPYNDFGETFQAVHDVDVVENKVPFRYVQLDSYWYFKGVNGGVTNWTATPQAFPNGLRDLSEKTGFKYVAHNRYWSAATTYATKNGGDYDFILEPTKGIPTEQKFWDDLMINSSKWGMSVYEQDWLHNEWEGLNATLTSATLAHTWLQQMGNAATKASVKIQYCMAYSRFAIASADVAAVNQIRASDDYATGVKTGDHDLANGNLYIGTSSMLSASLGMAPSKDVFWTNSSVRYPVNSHSKYQDANEPFPILQAAVALMSCGPVGPGDKVGSANASLISKTCRSDGLLLKPGYPATPVEKMFARRSESSDIQMSGEVNAAYTIMPSQTTDAAGIVHLSIIAMDVIQPLQLTSKDLGFAADADMLVWSDDQGPNSAKTMKTITISSCAKSNFLLFHVQLAPAAGVVALLGETGKFCPHSTMRFKSFSSSQSSKGVTAAATYTSLVDESIELSFFYNGHVHTHVCGHQQRSLPSSASSSSSSSSSASLTSSLLTTTRMVLRPTSTSTSTLTSTHGEVTFEAHCDTQTMQTM